MNPWRITFTGEIEVYPPSPAGVTGGAITFTTERETRMGEITVKDTETTLAATVSFFDAEGAPATPDQTPVWAVADPTVLTCTPADDGLSATFAVGSPGVCSVTVSTVETHEGVGAPTDVLLTGLVTVTAGDVVTGSVDFTTSTPAP